MTNMVTYMGRPLDMRRRQSGIDPLLTFVQTWFGLKTRSALYDLLDIEASSVARMRRCGSVTPNILLKLHDASGIPINELRVAANIPAVAPITPKEK